MLKLARLHWQREAQNPILAPDPRFPQEAARCMNPFIMRLDDEYRLYYSGGDAEGRQRICLATAPLDAPTTFTRRSVVLELGMADAFDSTWCVLPCVRRIAGQWHLYYSGMAGTDRGLQSFWGIGLAISDDGLHFERYATDPIITGNLTAEYPQNRGIAGGSIIEETSADGVTSYRMYYTLSVGVPSDNVAIAQEKHCVVCHSHDGLHWTDHRLILSPRHDAPNDDIAVATPVVWREDGLYRMLYSGIGTRWGGNYGISEAVSFDGYAWRRGEPGENLCLEYRPDIAWEAGMVEYPAILSEANGYRLYYCATGYGATGIGTATASITRE